MPSVPDAAILPAGAHDQAQDRAADRALRLGASGRGEVIPPVHARRALLWRVQFALKPAPKALGLHGGFIRGKRLKYLISDGAFKRIQVDSPGAGWLTFAGRVPGSPTRSV